MQIYPTQITIYCDYKMSNMASASGAYVNKNCF